MIGTAPPSPAYNLDRVRDYSYDNIPLRAKKTAVRRPSILPIEPSLGVLGRKWALIILADIGFRKLDGFNKILHSNPALTPRVLSRRLHELNQTGVIMRLDEKRKAPSPVSWILTEQGRDLLPVIIRLVAYTARWNNNYRFQGRMPRPLTSNR